MRRYQFLALSILAAAAFIAILTASEQRAGLLDDLQAENDYLNRRLNQSLDQQRQLTDRLLELEALPSRGGRNHAAADLDRALAGTGLAGLGQALCVAEAETGVSAVLLAAICAHESGWGRSKLAREKNNLAGLGAYDGREYSCGMAFESRADCIEYLARLLAGRPGTLDEVGAWYASDLAWSKKVAGCVRVIANVF